ncbi:MAG TPA: hypothetical protein VI078_02645 [bacterium]
MSAARIGRRRRRGSGQEGVALLLAVWLLALLAVVAGETIFSTRVRAAAERNRRDDLRGWSLAIAGYRAALAALDDRITAVGVDEDKGDLLLYYRGDGTGTPAFAKDVALGDGTYSWRISDESGLVPINGIQQRSVLVGVLKLCGMAPGSDRDTVVDSILDWRDVGSEHRINGAEEDYYRSLDPPYSCKDGPLDVVEELLLVRGVTPELFFGTGEGEKRVPGLRDLLTVYSLEGEILPNAATVPKALREELKIARVPRGQPSRIYRIVATGDPGAGAPKRTVQAVVSRGDTGGTGGTRTFALLYWNDTSSPEPVGREESH